MRSHFAVLIFLFAVVFRPAAAYAFREPPAKIIDENNSSKCIAITESYLMYQSPGYGTGAKGPAIDIKNKCQDDFEIYDIRSSSVPDAKKTSMLPLEIYGDLVLDKNCIKISEKGTQFEKQYITCGPIKIPFGSYATIPMPWGTYFEILGRPDISISGHMINPEKPAEASTNSEAVADLRFVLNADNILEWKPSKDGFSVKLTEGGRKTLSSLTSANVGKFMDLYLGSVKISEHIRINQPMAIANLDIVFDKNKRKTIISLLPSEKQSKGD